jgi:glycosyltransferase involved in cell wall biosynthesis
MKILFDARVLTHKIYTGIEVYSNYILNGILKNYDIKVSKPNTMNKYLSHLWLHTILPFIKSDIIISPANIAPIYIPKSKKLILTLHDLAFIKYKDTFSSFFRFYYTFLVPFNVKRASKIITVSNSSKEEIESFYPDSKGKVEVIHNGIDSKFKQNKNISKKNQILYVGSLNKRKNFISVLKMFEKLDDKSVSLKMVGNFSSNFDIDNDTNQMILEAKSNEKISFLQNVTTDELVELYNESKLFIYPSFYEGFGFPVVEAMACGTPVLCSDTTSLPEIGGDAAMYCDPNDLDDILCKTKMILDSDEMQSDMIKKGLEQSKKFTIDLMIEQHLKVLNKVMNEK